MNISNIKKVALTGLLLGGASASQAGFVAIDNVVPAAASTIEIVNSNDFKSTFASIGVNSYTLGASLGTDTGGTVTYYYYGKEAGYQNIFFAGNLFYSSAFTPQTQNYFGAPKLIGTTGTTGGLLDFGFCALSSPGVSVGCVTNAQNDAFSMGSLQSVAFSLAGNVAWLFWDDSGAGPDDNHDDMLIKAVFTPASVPEPATLGLFGMGLAGLWFAAKRRQRNA